jgi:hypothetical protein
MYSGSIEYNRVTRLTKNTSGFNEGSNFYLTDLSNTTLELTLQNKDSKLPINGFEPLHISSSLIESPSGSISPLNGDNAQIIIEFTIPKPSGSIPSGSNWFVEWNDGFGELDWFELDISDKTGDTTLTTNIPF